MNAPALDVEPIRPRDVGLQAERTALSWSRTGSAVLVNALLALRSGWASGESALTIVAFALLVASGIAILYGAWRRRHLLGGRGMTAPRATAIAAAAVVALITCGAGIASMLAHT